MVEAGTVLTISTGTPHAVGNKTEEAVVIRLEFRPALHIESFFELLYGLARDGKTNRQGAPNLLQMAVYSTAHPNQVYMAGIPVGAQKVMFALLSPLGRLLGYKALYPPVRSPLS